MRGIIDQALKCIQLNISSLETLFGEGAILALARELQDECDEELTRLLKRFIVDRKAVALANKVFFFMFNAYLV